MASKFRSLYDDETQKALSSVPTVPETPAVDIAKAQTLARSSNSPEAQKQGNAMLDEDTRQQAVAQRDAVRQGKADDTAAKAAERAQAKAVEDTNARNVRAAAAAGQKTTTDIETGKRTIEQHPDGSGPVYKAGPQGDPVKLGDSLSLIHISEPTRPY